jgi:hypothetical protein
MGIGSRPAACASCGKRLSRKQWYYRHDRYYCKKRCWLTEREKLAGEGAAGASAPVASSGAGSSEGTPPLGGGDGEARGGPPPARGTAS